MDLERNGGVRFIADGRLADPNEAGLSRAQCWWEGGGEEQTDICRYGSPGPYEAEVNGLYFTFLNSFDEARV